MSSMELRKIEDCKIECAKKFFSKITSDEVKYDVVDGVGEVVYSHAFMPKNPATGSWRHPFGKARNARCARVAGWMRPTSNRDSKCDAVRALPHSSN